MSAPRPFSRLVLAVGLALVIAGFVGLMFGVGNSRAGMRMLPQGGEASVEVFRPADAALTPDDVRALPGTAWRAWDGRGYIKASHGRVLWVRVVLRNPADEPLHSVLAGTAYFSDAVEAWISPAAAGGSGWTHLVSGEALAGHAKVLWSRTPAFPVNVPARGERVVYLRASDYYIAFLQPRWWPRAKDFFEAQLRDVLAEGICYGGLLALLLYNLGLWMRLRFADTGFYVLYAGASAVFNFVGNGGLALLGLGVGSPGKEMIMTGALALEGLFVVQFARVFLGTGRHLPRTDRWLRRWQAVMILLLLGVPGMAWQSRPVGLDLTIVALAATHLVLLAVAVAAWRAGGRHARFFVSAFGLLFAGIVPALFTWAEGDILAGAAMGLLAGSTLEMVLLSFAVADRFAQTQSRLVEETEQRRMIEQTYADELEIEVRERTRELQEANADKDRMLAVIGHDLRSPLTGLMRAADGEPGEFARGISRIGRALLLLIEDLVLWTRLRAGSRVLAVHPARAVTAPAVALHRALADHDCIELVVAVPETLRVGTDLVLAQTLMRNLLANALKFARSRVELRAERVEGGVRFAVLNDGTALPPDVAARITANLDEPLSATGGLGLRLCREICQAFGTKLEASVVAGGGTMFSFILRAAPAGENSGHPFP